MDIFHLSHPQIADRHVPNRAATSDLGRVHPNPSVQQACAFTFREATTTFTAMPRSTVQCIFLPILSL